MLLDKGGARIRDEEAQSRSIDAFMKRVDEHRSIMTEELADRASAKVTSGPRVRVRVEETHDGEACECITKEMTVEIGQSIELEHVCHDGRVDIVRATVISVE